MTAAKKLNLTSEEDYLASELTAEVKHEYLGGVVYATAADRLGWTTTTLTLRSTVSADTVSLLII